MNFTIELVRTTQTRLAELKYYTGKLDGQAGRLTSQAVIDFKSANGMVARDFPGPLTLTALFDREAKPKKLLAATSDTPLWGMEARRLLGVKETPGKGNNPVIMQWAIDLDQWYPDDATAWCGLFVAHCMATGAPDVPQDFNRLGAREWGKYGVECDPGMWAIATFTRPGSAWAGHTGFIVGADAEAYHILGGNQSDMVNVTRVSKSRFITSRCPPGFVPNTNLKPVTTGDLSLNEA